MRLKMAILVMLARLNWGEFLNQEYLRSHRLKFFPPPQVTVHKLALTNYFFRN